MTYNDLYNDYHTDIVVSWICNSTNIKDCIHMFPTANPEDTFGFAQEEAIQFYNNKHHKEALSRGFLKLLNLPNFDSFIEGSEDVLRNCAYSALLFEVPNSIDILKRIGFPDPTLIHRNLHIDLNRFIKNQNSDVDGYEQALLEINNGKKENHWIWWNFPQMEAITRGIHRSWETEYFGIRNRQEAIAYMHNDILREHLINLCEAIVNSEYSVRHIFNNDWIKVKSCMNLFHSVEALPIFLKVLSKL